MAWSIWAGCGVTAMMLTRNPLYSTLIILAACLVYISPSGGPLPARLVHLLIGAGVRLLFLTITATMLALHEGEQVLFSLPSGWFLIGGAITQESAWYGLVVGVALWAQVLLLAAAIRCISAPLLDRLLARGPGRMSVWAERIGLRLRGVIRGIREGLATHQAEREGAWHWHEAWSHSVPRIRDGWRQAVAARPARASATTTAMPKGDARVNLIRSRLSEGLLVQLVGAIALVRWDTSPWIGQALVAVGAVLLALALVAVVHSVPAPDAENASSRRGVVLVVPSSAVALGMMIVVGALDPKALRYSPHLLAGAPPEFNAWIGLSLAMLALPGYARLVVDAARPPSET